MQTFLEWLITERRELVPPEVLSSYEQGFREALQKVLQRVQDPVLKARFSAMLDCPIKDANGRCRSFTDYIVSALMRHQIHRRADIEDALAYTYENMMLDTKLTGQPKSTLFGGFDSNRPYPPGGNPMEARFKTAVANCIRNLENRLSRVSSTAGRPQGSIHISPGQSRPGEMAGMISADEIPERKNAQKGLAELVSDITSMLARKETEYRLPLNAMFGAMLAGQPPADKQRHFGGSAIKKGKPIIVKTIKQYAKDSGNSYLLGLLSKIENPVESPRTKPAKAVPQFTSLKDKDFASIMRVVDGLGRPAGTADLGRYRRRWLEYPPRDASGAYRNRLEEVLHQMVRDGALRTIQTGRGATAYLPGPAADQYRRSVAA